ncbi:uncharacterized protein LOC144363558 [Saccoglossus kowalevskii]
MVITGKDDDEHLANIEAVLQRLQEYNLRANLSKCKFFQDSIEFCSHIIDKDGLHMTQEKIKAVVEAPKPENVTQVRAFLGLINYYHRFLPDLATVLHPLNRLLEKKHELQWTEKCDNAFTKAKRLITSDKVLAHYDPDLQIKIACDACWVLGCSEGRITG